MSKQSVSVKTLVEFFNGISEMQVSKLVKLGVVIRTERGQYDFLQSTKNYIRYLQNRKANQHDGTEGAEGYEGHRARLTKAKADISEVQAALLKGTAHEASAIQAEWSDMIGSARTKLLALPSKLAPKVHGQESLAVVRAELETAVLEALNELSQYEPTLVTRRYVAGHQQDLDTSAEVDGEPMGRRDPEA